MRARAAAAESYTSAVVVGERKRIGVFGGTFDPPHVGHLIVAADACDQLALDTVLLVVANVPWQKVGSREISHPNHRLAMVESATAADDSLTSSAVEIERGGPSYMVDTLAELTQAYDDSDLFLLVGSDAAGGLDTWDRHEQLAQLARVVVFPRPGHEHERPPQGIVHDVLRTPLLEVSSSDLRRRVSAGRSIRYLVPEGVRRIIENERLYL